MSISHMELSAVSDADMIQFMDRKFLGLVYGWFNGGAMGAAHVPPKGAQASVDSVLAFGRFRKPKRNKGVRHTLGPGQKPSSPGPVIQWNSNWTKKHWKEWLQWLDRLHKLFPQKTRPIYRVITIPKGRKLLPDSFVGKYAKLNTARNIVQSWAETYDAAYGFHKFTSGLTMIKNSPFPQRIIVSTKAQPITSRNTIIYVLEWLKANAEKYAAQAPDEYFREMPGNPKRFAMKGAGYIAKMLKKKLFQGQREVLVYVPKPIRVKVEAVFTAPGARE